MPTIQVNGTQLEYVESGEGEPVVFVHGTLGDVRSWQPQIEAFARHHRVIAYSRRYHHPNDCRSDGPDYSAAVHADDLAQLVAGLGLDAAHVVGSSYGAYTGLVLAARHPGCVRALVLSEPPVFPLLDRTAEGRALRADFLATVWEPAGAHMARGEAEDGVRTFVDGLFGHGAFRELPEEVRGPIMDNAPEFALETASPVFWTPFTCEDAAGVAAPTLLLSGASSRRLFELIVDELERCLPRNRRVHLPSSHDLPGDDTAAYNEMVLGFLARHST